MIPTYRNSSPSFPFELNNEVHDLSHPLVSTNYQVASSSSYSTCQTFFNSTITNQDQIGYYHAEFYQPQHQPEVDKYASRSGSHDLEKKNKAENGLKITLWKKGNRYHENQNEKNPVKNLDRASMEVTSTNHTYNKMKLQDQKQHQSISPLRSTDHGSNSSSNNSNNIPNRVCADCHTTKTPLWRSGPQGPKSLCNACGIRQRKARRAMAAAAAAANGTNFTAAETSSAMKIKVQQQKQKITKVNTNRVVPFKKRCKFTNATVGSSSSNTNNAQKKLCFEDFFLNLSNNLAFHRVFPQDEKEAAILLMALSSGLVHG